MDSANAIFVCGAECGLAATGTLSGGVEHWAAVTGAPTVVTSGPSAMRSTRCFRFNVAGSNAFLTHTFATAVASPATVVTRFYVYFTTLPNSDTDIYEVLGGAAGAAAVRFVSSDSSLRARAIGTNAASGLVVTAGVWYLVDVKSVFNTTTTCDLTVNGSAQAQASAAGSADTGASVRFGPASATTTDCYIDDILVSGTSAEFPIGDGTCVGLYPFQDAPNDRATASGNRPMDHSWSATTDFGKGAGGTGAMGLQEVENSSVSSLANPLSTTIGANWISDFTGGTNEWAAWKFAPLPPGAGRINGVMGVFTAHASAATACTVNLQLGEGDHGAGATYTTGLPAATTGFNGFVDMSETTIAVSCGVFPTRNGTAWDAVGVNKLKVKFLSDDVTPDPFLDGVCMEVDFVPSSAFDLPTSIYRRPPGLLQSPNSLAAPWLGTDSQEPPPPATPWAQIVAAGAVAQPPPVSVVIPSYAPVAPPFSQFGATNVASTAKTEPPQVSLVARGLHHPIVETVPVPKLLLLTVPPIGPPPPTVTPGRDPRAFIAAPVVQFITATALPQPPPQTVGVYVAQQPQSFIAAPVVVAAESSAPAEPPPRSTVTRGLDHASVETVPVLPFTRSSAPAEPPRESDGWFVVDLTVTAAAYFVPTIQGNAFPQPPPSATVTPSFRDPRVEFAYPVFLISAAAVPQPVPLAPGVITGPQVASINGVSGPNAWYDASDAATIIATAGAVSQWNDKSGNGFNLTQGTGVDEPTTGTRVSPSGLNVIDFDGNDWVTTNWPQPSTPLTVFAVWQADTIDATTRRIVAALNAGSDVTSFVLRTGTGLPVSGGSGVRWALNNTATPDLAAATGVAYLSSAVFDGANGYQRLNTTTGGTSITGAFVTATGLRLGSGFVTTNAHDGWIAEVIVFTRQLTGPEIAAVEAYLRAKWFADFPELTQATRSVDAVPQPAPRSQVIVGPQVTVAAAAYFVPTIQANAVAQPSATSTVMAAVGDPSAFNQRQPIPALVARNVEQPPTLSSVAAGRDPRGFIAAPVVRAQQSSALPEPAPQSAVTRGMDHRTVETVPVFVTVQSTAVPQPTTSATVTPNFRDPRLDRPTTGQFIQSTAFTQPPPPAQGIYVALQAGTPPGGYTNASYLNIYATPFPQPVPTVAVYPNVRDPRLDRPTMGAFVSAAAVAPPAPTGQVALGLDHRVVETVPVPDLIAAAAVPQPAPTVGVTRGLDHATVETVPVPRFVTSPFAIAQPAPDARVIPNFRDPRLDRPTLGAFIQATAFTQPPPAAVGVYVALTPGTPPGAVIAGSYLNLYATAFAQPVPAARVIPNFRDPRLDRPNRWYPIQSSASTEPPARSTVTVGLTPVAAQVYFVPNIAVAAIVETRPSSLVIPGRDPASFIAAPVVLRVQGTAFTQTPPSALLTPGPRVTEPRFGTVYGTAFPQPTAAVRVLVAFDHARAETVPVPRLLTATAFPQPAPAALVTPNFRDPRLNQPIRGLMYALARTIEMPGFGYVWLGRLAGISPLPIPPGVGRIRQEVVPRRGIGMAAAPGGDVAAEAAESGAVRAEAEQSGVRADSEATGGTIRQEVVE